MTRRSLIRDFARQDVAPGPDDAWSWSMWRGYLDSGDGKSLQEWFAAGGARACHLHTSGHASPADLKAFAQAMQARCVVPIHGAAWDAHADGFAGLHPLRNGEPFDI
jgi:ribonuclease J